MTVKAFFKWIVILALLGGGGYAYYQFKMKKTEADVPSYDRASVEVRDLRVVVESTGEIAPRNRLDVKPPIAGRVEELLVDEGDSVEKGQIIGWISSTERATLLDAALAKSEEEYEYWKKLYNPTPLISPLKGTVIVRNFEPGQSIESKDAVVVIADDLIVLANLDETDIGQIKPGQQVRVRLESYPDREFLCEVEKIAYDARTVSNVTMYEVDVLPSEKMPGFARSGMTANLEFVIEEKLGVLAIVSSAIQSKPVEERSKEGASAQAGSSDDMRERMMARMRENGMSDEEIKQRLAERARSGDEGGSRRSGGKKSSRKKSGGVAIVLIDSENPAQPMSREIQTGISDGQYTEVVSGLDEGDEVLIQKIKISAKKSGGSNPFMSSRGGGGGRR